jgi:hypothetical protein
MSANPSVRAILGRRVGGFTIIELLLACALTVAIAALALTLMAQSLNHWNRSLGTLTTEGQARIVLDQLALDLQAACHRDDGQVWLAATIQADTNASGAWINGTKPVAGSLDPAVAGLTEARFGKAGVWLRFFTATPRSGQPAAPAAVAYQIIRRAPTPAGQASHYLLYRSEAGSAETLAAGYDIDGPPYAAADASEGAAGSVASPGIRHVLADNIIDFGVRLFGPVPDAATGRIMLQRIFPLNKADLEYRTGLPGAGDSRRPFPSVVDVMVRVLTDEGARQIATLEAGQLAGDWWAIANAHSRVFTRRVMVRANPA